MKLKLCKDCKHSKSHPNYSWTLNCQNPLVNARDPWALAGTEFLGTECRTERDKRWWAACGMKGKLWESKN